MPGTQILKLIDLWPEIVGATLAQCAIPLKNTNQSLTIITNHSVVSHELKNQEEKLKKMIFEKVPGLRKTVKNLTFQVNPGHFRQDKRPGSKEKTLGKQKPHSFSPQYQKAKKEIEEMMGDTADKETKELLSSLLFQSLQ